VGVYWYDCDKKRNRHDILFPKATCRLLDGLKLGSGLLLIVVNCCVACRAAMCVGYMKCLLSLTCSVWCSLSVRTTLQSVPKYLVWFIGYKLWCWVVIKAVGRMRFLLRHNRCVWCWILITLQFKPEELSDLYSAANMSLCADANISGTFLHFLGAQSSL